MIKIVALVRRRPDLTVAEFRRTWLEDVAALAVRLPGLREYRQNHALDERAQPWDGVAELWFDDSAGYRTAFSSAEGAELAALEATVFEEVQWFVVEEQVILMPGSAPPPAGRVRVP